MLVRLLTTLLFAGIITIVLVIDAPSRFLGQSVYALITGFFLWLFVDVGDCIIFNTAGKKFPYTFQRYVYAFVAVVVANFLGFYIGDALIGWEHLTYRLGQVCAWIFIEFGFAVFLIWLFSQKQRHEENQISTNNARLKLLESQLEPHMLFNTLANLRALIQTDTEFAIKMLDRIVDYMRATLGGSRAVMHPLKKEFERLDDYLDLMKLRMGDRLNYTLYLCPELDGHLVPPFILQPLVENAIKHGLEPKVEGGRIFIMATIEGKMVSLEVNDTGVGTNQDEVKKTNGFGWAQVSERLLTTYGDKYTINLVAAEGYITSVKITFPYTEAEESMQ